MRKFILLLSLVLLSFLSYSQKERLDSLFNRLNTEKIDSNKYSILVGLARAYADSSYDKSLEYFNRALEIADGSRDRMKLAYIYHQIGFVYQKKGELSLALTNYTNALTVHEYMKNKKGIGQILNDIGLIYRTWGKYDKALENYIASQQIFEEIGDVQNEAMVSNNIGQIYYYRNEYLKAIEYFKNYLEVNKQFNNPRAVAGASNNIGSCFLELEKYDEALSYFTQCMRVYDSLKVKIGVAIIKDNIGTVYQRKKQYNDALLYHSDALKTFEQLGSQSRTCYTLQNLGLVYSKLNKSDLAIKYFKESLALAIKLNQKETEKDACEALALEYENKGMFNDALKYHKRFVQIKDSIFNAETINRIETIKADFESQKKEREIYSINQKLQNQRNFIIIFSGILIIFIFLIILVLRENNAKRKVILSTQKEIGFLNDTIIEHNNLYINQINSKNNIRSLFSEFWCISSLTKKNNDFPFISSITSDFAILTFISNKKNLLVFSLFEFLTSSCNPKDSRSLFDQFTAFLSTKKEWESLQKNFKRFEVGFFIIDRNSNKYKYSGSDRQVIGLTNKHEKIKSSINDWVEIKKDTGFYFITTSCLESFDSLEVDESIDTIEKTIRITSNQSLSEQREILSSNIDFLTSSKSNLQEVTITAFLL